MSERLIAATSEIGRFRAPGRLASYVGLKPRTAFKNVFRIGKR